MLSKIFVFVFVWCLPFNECARILAVAPLPSYSHQVAFRPIWKELSLRGHNVTLITTDGINDPSLTNLTEIVVHDETYRLWRESGVIELMKGRRNQLNLFATANLYMELFANLTKVVMEREEVKRLLQNDTSFDLVMAEPLLSIGLGFANRYKSKSIYVMSLEAPSYLHKAMGNPTHPVLYLETGSQFTAKTYIDRVALTVLVLLHYLFSSFFHSANTDQLRRHFGENTSPMKEIIAKANMIFVNVNPIFAGVRPVTPSTIYYGGGSHLEPEKPLPKDLREFLDGAVKGAVLFSLGTNVLSKDLSEEKRKVLLDTFKELPFRFLWKFEDDSLQNLPKNVKIAKWVPQQDILRHPNVKAFITQCGLQSTEEAIFSKVPIVGMPQIADQLQNVERIVELGLGVKVDFENLNKEALMDAILDVTTNTSYCENMEEFVKLSTDRPMTGIEEIVWWTEYVLRHNSTEHLKGPARKIPMYQFLLLDVIAGILLVMLIVCYLFIKLLKFLGRFLLSKVLGKAHKD